MFEFFVHLQGQQPGEITGARCIGTTKVFSLYIVVLFCFREELAEGSLRSPGLVLEAQNVVRRGSGERRKEIEHDTVKDVGNNNEDQVPQKKPR